MTEHLTLWTSAEMEGEGLSCMGIGRKELGTILTISANGMEWEMVVHTNSRNADGSKEWYAMDRARFESKSRVEPASREYQSW